MILRALGSHNNEEHSTHKKHTYTHTTRIMCIKNITVITVVSYQQANDTLIAYTMPDKTPFPCVNLEANPHFHH
jgi:hypothetical protein